MRLAITFPGQGAQAPGLGRPWTDHPAWSVVDEVRDATGVDLGHLLLDAGPDELADTRSSQLAVLAASLLAWRAVAPVLEAEEPVAVAGHSLGQVTALIASGAVAPEEGYRLAVARAEATAAGQAAHPGAMVALLGADEALAAEACRAAPGRAWVANLNAPGQVVVGAEVGAIDAVADRAAELGARRIKRLPVDGAFHTPLLAGAARALAPVLAATGFHAPRWPLVTNHDGEAVTTGDGWPDRLSRHLVEPVRWEAVVRRAVGLGAEALVEVGPGTTLASLAKRIAPDLEVRSVATPADVPVGSGR